MVAPAVTILASFHSLAFSSLPRPSVHIALALPIDDHTDDRICNVRLFLRPFSYAGIGATDKGDFALPMRNGFQSNGFGK